MEPKTKDWKEIRRLRQLSQNNAASPEESSNELEFWYDIGSSNQVEGEPKPPRQYPLHPRFLEQDCPFFVKVPREIRLRIFEDCLGGLRIHLMPGLNADRKLSGEKCQEPDQVICLQKYGRCTQWSTRKQLNLGLSLALLLTCRQIYEEAVESLYSSNEFWITQNQITFLESTDGETRKPNLLPTLRNLPHALPPRLVSKIRTLKIYFSIPTAKRGYPRPGKGMVDEGNWNTVWSALAAMKGLQDLEIFFEGPQGPPPDDTGVSLDSLIKYTWLEREKEIFKGIAGIRVGNSFKIVLPYVESDLNMEVGDSRCRFEHRRDLGEGTFYRFPAPVKVQEA